MSESEFLKAGDIFTPDAQTQRGSSSAEMTLRDWFAALSMNATIAKCPLVDTTGEQGELITHETLLVRFRRIAVSSYAMADAMLAEREK